MPASYSTKSGRVSSPVCPPLVIRVTLQWRPAADNHPPCRRGFGAMQSHLKPCAAAALVLLACLLHRCRVQAAVLRQHQPWGGDSDRRPAHTPLLPSAEMAKALEYIESLQERDRPDYDDNGERFRPRWGQEAEGQGGAAPREDHVSQQLLKTLLSTLQGASEDPHPAAATKNGDDIRKNTEAGDYGGYPFPKHSKQHKKYPLMFEEEDSRESPYKRTNENVEPQYTPQSLATLQSVFQDLGKLSTPQEYKRRQAQELYRGDRDLFPFSDLAYADVLGGGDWTPMEEKVETEEEIKDSREEFDKGLDSSEDDDDDDDDDDGDDDGDDENDVKRSSQPPKYRGKDDPEDFTKLVDYYLLKVLEKTEESEQKREEEDAERRSVQPSYDVDPQAVYQLIKISQKLQIPPEDLVEMLQSREMRKQKKLRVPEEETDDLERVEEKLMHISTYSKDHGPITKYYSRRLPEALANNLKILHILGMETRGSQRGKALQQQRNPKSTHTRYYAHSGRHGNHVLPAPSISDHREGDYDDAVDEDKLATYLAAKMLAQYPKAMSKVELKRAPQPPPQDEAFGPFEQAVLDYFEQLASEKGSRPKRIPEPEGTGDSPQTQRLDDETLMRMLEYLNPETSESEERDLYGQNTGGM
ncbi:secretogranin-2a isoform X1 [Anguilla rostrata]|uniref:secretogranin-2a isoform X1 n=2 Tax=Anguilla rostrata TaxID=7938 RepID=UPI0030CF215F